MDRDFWAASLGDNRLSGLLSELCKPLKIATIQTGFIAFTDD